MKKLVLFVGKTPSRDEVEKKFAVIMTAAPKLEEEIAVLETRLKNARTLVDVLQLEETKHKDAIRNRLVQELDVKAMTEDLNKVRTNLTNKTTEIEGLEILIEKKSKQLASYQGQMKEKNYLLALADLFLLFDKYNKEAAGFAETVREVYEAFGTAQQAGRACGNPISNFINPSNGIGIPEAIPAILWDGSVLSASNRDKTFWHEYTYAQDKLRAQELREDAARQ
jgi:hypothetical protein